MPTTGLDLARPADSAVLGSGFSRECWSEDDMAELICCQVLEITHDVKSFVFEAEYGEYFRFQAGQFITLHLEIDGDVVTRCYTISSPPTRPHRIAITVKRVLGGRVSNWLHDNLRPGSRVSVQAPLGAFTNAESTAKKFLFLSAGSGITPVMSMTRTLHDLGSDADVLFAHSARTPADIIFRTELEAIASVMPNVRVVHVCEADYPADRWTGLRGRLTRGLLDSLVPDLAERVTFTCGPAAYMASVRRILDEVGYDMRNYHEESFSFESLPEPERPAFVAVSDPVAQDSSAADTAPTDGAVSTYDVEFTRSGRTFTCRADENVLDAAFAAGLRPPSACSQGICGTCKTTKLGGEVEMQHNGGIRPKEIAQNKILICCSKPLSNLQIDA